MVFGDPEGIEPELIGQTRVLQRKFIDIALCLAGFGVAVEQQEDGSIHDGAPLVLVNKGPDHEV